MLEIENALSTANFAYAQDLANQAQRTLNL